MGDSVEQRNHGGAQNTGLIPYSSALRLSFVDSDLGFLPLLPSCYAHPARFPPAQAESGIQSNISTIGTQNLGLRADMITLYPGGYRLHFDDFDLVLPLFERFCMGR